MFCVLLWVVVIQGHTYVNIHNEKENRYLHVGGMPSFSKVTDFVIDSLYIPLEGCNIAQLHHQICSLCLLLEKGWEGTKVKAVTMV